MNTKFTISVQFSGKLLHTRTFQMDASVDDEPLFTNVVNYKPHDCAYVVPLGEDPDGENTVIDPDCGTNVDDEVDMVSSSAFDVNTEDLTDACEPDEEELAIRKILGPDCVIKRISKDGKFIRGAQPEEMQKEMMSAAEMQQRMSACVEHVRGMNREQKLNWALKVKNDANRLYYKNEFDEAANLYNECLVALDFDGSEEDRAENNSKLLLPVCTNLAACMIEKGCYERCIEICNMALRADPTCVKALFRSGLSYYRLGDFDSARPKFVSAQREVLVQRPLCTRGAEEIVLDDLAKRIDVYLKCMRLQSKEEREQCMKMFEQAIYQDMPLPGTYTRGPCNNQPKIDDSDAMIDELLARHRGRCCGRSRLSYPDDGLMVAPTHTTKSWSFFGCCPRRCQHRRLPEKEH